MKWNESPLETVSRLSGLTDLDINTEQKNRYCILLNRQDGYEAYYFSTPIYQIDNGKSVKRKFEECADGFILRGSSANILVTEREIHGFDHEKEFLIPFKESVSFRLSDGILISDKMTLIPNYNGVLIKGHMENMQFSIKTNFVYTGIKQSKNCVSYMEGQFKPIVVFSALFGMDHQGNTTQGSIKWEEKNHAEAHVSIDSCPRAEEGLLSIDFYEPKLLQDTPVSQLYPTENNAFGPIVYVGNSQTYGIQWLYSRLDLTKLSELKHACIQDMTLYIPLWGNSCGSMRYFGLPHRFCSFGSTWSNKIQRGKMLGYSHAEKGYAAIPLNNIYLYQTHLTESDGFVLTSVEHDQWVSTISTADHYTCPQILRVRYTK